MDRKGEKEREEIGKERRRDRWIKRVGSERER